MAMVQYRSRGGKSSGKVAKLAKGKDTSTRVLAKSIKALQQKVNKQGIDLYYKNLIGDVNISSDCLSFNVCDYVNYTNTFGSSSDDDVYNRIKHLSSKMDLYINMYNEYNNTQFTAFLVSLKDEIGSSFNPSTGALSLTNDQHYTKVSTYSGQIHLNPRYFKVHRVKRFIVGNNGGNLTVAAGIANDMSKWYNATATYNLATTTAILYLNGVQIGSDTSFANNNVVSNLSGSIGNENGSLSLSGNIATTLIYNRALSAAEVRQNYNALKSRFGLT